MIESVSDVCLVSDVCQCPTPTHLIMFQKTYAIVSNICVKPSYHTTSTSTMHVKKFSHILCFEFQTLILNSKNMLENPMNSSSP